MATEKNLTTANQKPNKLAALPAFDAAIRKIVATPKAEVEKREREEKARKLAAE